MEIKRLGSYQEVDDDGYLIKIASMDNIRGAWLDVVTAVQQAYLTKWGHTIHSIYVRGSLAKGWAVKNVSDVDTFAVLHPGSTQPPRDTAWETITEEEIQTQFPYINGVELSLISYQDAIRRSSVYAFIIKVEAVCLYGPNLAKTIGKFKLNNEIAYQARYFSDQLATFLHEYPDEPTAEKPDFVVWIMRRFLRLGMELVMQREQRYTRDLYLCYESFTKYYPQKQTHMYQALELAINPTTDQSVIDFAQTFGAWLAIQAKRLID